jgi:O-antigen ligase
MTFSRGALLAVIVGAGVMMLLLGMRQWLKAGIALAFGIGVVLMVISRERLFDLGGSGSEPTRFAIWRSSLQMLLDHPVFGVGPDQFLYQYGRRYIEPSAWPERYTSHPHNLVLDVWLRLGAAGVGVFTALAAGVWLFARRMRRSIRPDPIACGAVAALAGGAAHGLVDNGYFLPDLAAATWIAIAMLLTVDRKGSVIAPTGDATSGF